MTLTEAIYLFLCLLLPLLFSTTSSKHPNSQTTHLHTHLTATIILDHRFQQQELSIRNPHHGLLSALPRSPTPASVPASLIRCQLPINPKTHSSTTTVAASHNACRKLPSLPRSSSYQTSATSPQMRVTPLNAESHANMTEPRLRLPLSTTSTTLCYIAEHQHLTTISPGLAMP
jgi:hypothetical protein